MIRKNKSDVYCFNSARNVLLLRSESLQSWGSYGLGNTSGLYHNMSTVIISCSVQYTIELYSLHLEMIYSCITSWNESEWFEYLERFEPLEKLLFSKQFEFIQIFEFWVWQVFV